MPVVQSGAAMGQHLDSSVIEVGLRELNSDITVDPGGKQNIVHPFIEDRMGIYHLNKHITPMDRGMVPEFKLWYTRDEPTEVPLDQLEREEVSLRYRAVPPSTEGFSDLWNLALDGSDPAYEITSTGQLIRWTAVAIQKRYVRVWRVGWRHTFEKLIHANIAGVTRESLGAKFGVDMLKFPVGSPQEVVADLTQE